LHNRRFDQVSFNNTLKNIDVLSFTIKINANGSKVGNKLLNKIKKNNIYKIF